MPKLNIDLSGIGGLAPRYYGDLPFSSSNQNLRIIGAGNSYASGKVNPIARLGYLSPASNTFIDVTNSITATSVLGAKEIDVVNSKIYLQERSTKIHVLDSYADNSAAVLRTIAGASGTDLEAYQINGVRRLFYSYQAAGGGNIGTYNLSTLAFDDTWLSATAAGGFLMGATNNHRMIVADNGFMYVLDGSSLHKIDGASTGGANGTATANVLLFPAYFQLIDGLDFRGRLWIALMQSPRNLYNGQYNESVVSEKCGVYLWDRQSTQLNMADYIPLDGVREIRNIFSFRGLPHCFTISSTRQTQLRRYNGSDFEVIAEYGSEDYPRFPDSLSVSGDRITWLGNNGEIHSFGRIAVGLQDGSYEIGSCGNFPQGNSGVLVNAGQGISGSTGNNTTPEGYYLNWYDSTAASNYLKKWYPHASDPENTAITPHAGNFYSLVKLLPKLSKVNSVTIFYPPTTDSGVSQVLDLDIFLNQSTASWGTTTLTRTDGVRGYKYVPVGEININAIQVKLTWKTGNNLGSNTITPSHIEVDYDPTPKKM